MNIYIIQIIFFLVFKLIRQSVDTKLYWEKYFNTTQNQYNIILKLIKRANEYHQILHLRFVDYEKAFDTVRLTY